MINAIVAFDKNHLIGIDGKLPWHIKEDIQHFKRMTLRCPVIMGRKTWESLPNDYLIDRINIVVTKNAQKYNDDLMKYVINKGLKDLEEGKFVESETVMNNLKKRIENNDWDDIVKNRDPKYHVVFGPYFAKSLKDALDLSYEFIYPPNNEFPLSKGPIWLIGGHSIYEKALDKKLINKLIVSEIDIENKEEGKKIYFPKFTYQSRKILNEYQLFKTVEYIGPDLDKS